MWESQTTKNMFLKNGEYNEERKRLHEEIVRMFISDKGLDSDVNELEAILFGGGSGTGKTRIIEKIIGTNGYVLVDSDKIKELLPEYPKAREQKKPEAADIVHEESSDIAQLLLETSIHSKEPIIYDGTMKNAKKYVNIIKRLKAKGYTIQMVIVDADIEVAYDRVKKRFVETGRLVEYDLVKKSNYLVSAAFHVLYDMVNMYTVFENSSNTSDPVIIAYKDPDEDEVIVDMESYCSFLGKRNLV